MHTSDVEQMLQRAELVAPQGSTELRVCSQFTWSSSVFGKNMEMTDEVCNKTEAVTKCCYLPREARRALAVFDVFGSQGPAGTLVFIRGGSMRRKSVVSKDVGPTLVLAGSLI